MIHFRRPRFIALMKKLTRLNADAAGARSPLNRTRHKRIGRSSPHAD